MRAGLGNPKDPNYVTFALAMIRIQKYCQPDDRIAIVCDHDDETASGFYGYYKGIRHQHRKMQESMVSISFADDRYFPSLQAADMLAYLTRLEAKRMWYNERHDYGPLIEYLLDTKSKAPGKAAQWFVMFNDEAKLRSLKTSADVLAERGNK
jgi:hypothetical protein